MREIKVAFVAFSSLLVVSATAQTTTDSCLSFTPAPAGCSSTSGGSGDFGGVQCAALYDAYPTASDVGQPFTAGLARAFHCASDREQAPVIAMQYDEPLSFNRLCLQQSRMSFTGARATSVGLFINRAGLGVPDETIIDISTNTNNLQCFETAFTYANVTSVAFRLASPQTAPWYNGVGAATVALAYEGCGNNVPPAAAPAVLTTCALEILSTPATCALSTVFNGAWLCYNAAGPLPTAGDVDTPFTQGGQNLVLSAEGEAEMTLVQNYGQPQTFDRVCFQPAPGVAGSRRQHGDIAPIGQIEIYVDKGAAVGTPDATVAINPADSWLRCHVLPATFRGVMRVAFRLQKWPAGQGPFLRFSTLVLANNRCGNVTQLVVSAAPPPIAPSVSPTTPATTSAPTPAEAPGGDSAGSSGSSAASATCTEDSASPWSSPAYLAVVCVLFIAVTVLLGVVFFLCGRLSSATERLEHQHQQAVLVAPTPTSPQAMHVTGGVVVGAAVAATERRDPQLTHYGGPPVGDALPGQPPTKPAMNTTPHQDVELVPDDEDRR